jgi:excisionase family DNA binding protein
MIEKKWLRVEEAAVYANVGISYIRKLIKSGQLPAIGGRYYLINRLKLDACLEGLEAPQTKNGPPKRPKNARDGNKGRSIR